MSSSDQIVTFLFTDIEGSTALWESCPDHMRHALTAHDELLRAAIEQYEGHLFKTVGDGIYSAFTTPSTAVAAAVDIQRSVAKQDWSLPSPLRIRIALHTGEADTRRDDYFGLNLTRAMRILEIGHGGQILCSDSTEQSVRDSIPDDIEIAALGRVRLKSLQRPEGVFQINASGLQCVFPPLRSLETYIHNLPIQLTSFIGRDKELAAIRQSLSNSRLVTITGPGGSGKTRLALQAAAEMVDEFDRGVWMVELASITDPDLVPSAIASVLGVREEPGISLTQSIVRSYHGGRVLLLLDNCEHVVDAVASVAHDITTSCRNVKILSTSQERFQVPGETLIRVGPMPLPKKLRTGSTLELLTNDCVRLFLERAHAVNPTFKVDDQDASFLVRICTSLDGIPLAIELAAARASLLTLEQLERRLADRFKLLSGGSRTVAVRQRTLEAAIDWSFELLTEQERQLLMRLTVFSGGWTLEAAEQICCGDGVEQDEVLNLLDALVNKSFVTVDGDNVLRYRLLESLRFYCQSRRNKAESHDRQSRHANWFLERIRNIKNADSVLNQVKLLRETDREIDNVRTAIEFTKTSDCAACIELAYRMYPYWYSRGYLSEGIAAITSALYEDSKLNGDAAGGLERKLLRSKAFGNLAILQWASGHLDAADLSIQKAITLCGEAHDEDGLAANHINLALLANSRGDWELADDMNSRALEYYRSAHALEHSAAALAGLGLSAMKQRRFDQAESYYLEAKRLFEQSQDECAIGVVYCNLSEIYYLRTDYNQGIELARKGMDSAVSTNDGHRQITLLEMIAACEIRMGATDTGVRRLSAANEARVELRCVRKITVNAPFDDAFAEAQRVLSVDEFHRLWDTGRTLSLEQAVRLSNNEELNSIQPYSTEESTAIVA